MLHLVGILFPHINDDARSKSHQIGILIFMKLRPIQPELFLSDRQRDLLKQIVAFCNFAIGPKTGSKHDTFR